MDDDTESEIGGDEEGEDLKARLSRPLNPNVATKNTLDAAKATNMEQVFAWLPSDPGKALETRFQQSRKPGLTVPARLDDRQFELDQTERVVTWSFQPTVQDLHARKRLSRLSNPKAAATATNIAQARTAAI